MFIVDDQYTGEIHKFDTEDQAVEFCQEQDIIYYSRAIEYLAENDASLVDSLALAHEYGFTLDKLNSETLATILYQHNLSNTIEEDQTQ